MRALITITHRIVEHEDATAAGFETGFWWTVTDDLGRAESAAPDRDTAETYARMVAEAHGYTEVDVIEDVGLLDRKRDEARVDQMIAAHNAATL